MKTTEDREIAREYLYEQFARIGRALGNRHRLQIVEILAQGEHTVEDLAREARMPVVNTSQHLRTLRDAQIVAVRRDGLYAHYRLTDDRVFRIWQSIRDFGEARLTEVHSAIEAFRTDRGQMQAVSAAELRRLMDDGVAILLDVRPSIEYNTGHIPGARSVPLSELEEYLRELSRDTSIVAYCRGPYCIMADEAVTLLRQRGYEARRFAEGFPEWRAQGLPVEV